jgi:peptide/nickel transport system substrate-binding protein
VLLGTGAAGCDSAVDQEDGKEGGGGSRGGELVIAVSQDVLPKTPYNQGAPNAPWRRQVFSSLVRLERKTHEVVPELATEWTTTEGGRVTTLTLRDGVTWHSGRPFDAEDVAFNLEFLAGDTPVPPFAFKWLASRLDSVEADGKRSVRLAFSEPVNNVFDMLSYMVLIDRESAAELLAGDEVIGTGPFTYGEYRQGTSLRLKRYEKYWDAGKPRLDGVLVRIMTNPEARLAALRSGQVHLATALTAQQLNQLKDDDRFEVTPYETYSASVYLGANVDVRLLRDRQVRQGLQYAIDRERIAEEVYGGQAIANATPWNTTSKAYDSELAGRYARDVDKAKRMLADAGADGAEVVLQAAQSVSQTAEIVEFNLREAGLKPRLEVLNATQVQERVENRTLEGLYIALHGYNELNPADLTYGAAPYRVDENLFHFDDPRYATLAEEALRARGETEREAYRGLTSFLVDEAFCCDLVQFRNQAVTSGVATWDYSLWDDVLLDSAALS